MGRAVPAVARALDILELFLATPVVSAPEITERLGLPRTTVHELVTTLAARPYLIPGPARPRAALDDRAEHHLAAQAPRLAHRGPRVRRGVRRLRVQRRGSLRGRAGVRALRRDGGGYEHLRAQDPLGLPASGRADQA